MPYTTHRGVTSYHDHDTPAEYATGADEDRGAFNEGQDRAFKASEEIGSLLDALYDEPIPGKGAAMLAIADDLAALLARIRALPT